MTTMTTVEAREHFSELVNRTAFGKERIVLTRRGKNVAALIPLEDLRLLEVAEDKLDLIDAQAALKEAESKGTMSLEDFKTYIIQQ